MMVWLPRLRDDVLKVAMPLLSGAVARTAPSALKVTVPVGEPEPGEIGVTFAMKVTVWPNTEVVGDALTVVVVPSLVTVSVVLPALEVKLVSPL
jgi:hypothetical protein